jgi:hypothetical protein
MIHLISIKRQTALLKFAFNVTSLSVEAQCTCEALTQLNEKSRRAAYHKGDPKLLVKWNNNNEKYGEKMLLIGNIKITKA